MPMRNSIYAVASLCIALFSLAWQWVTPVADRMNFFDAYKESRVAVVGTLLALFLAVAAYRQPIHHRMLSMVAIAVASFAFLSAWLFVPA